MSKISDKEKVDLEKIAESAHKDFGEIATEYQAILAKETTDNKGGFSADIVQKRAITKLRNRYKRDSMNKRSRVVGKVFGMTSIRDLNSKLLEKVSAKFDKTADKRYIKTKKEKDKGKVVTVPDLDAEGNVQFIDYRRTIKKKDGSGEFRNRNYGEVIKPNMAQDLFGVFEVFESNGESLGVRWGKVSLSAKQCTYDVKSGVALEFEVTFNVKSQLEDFYLLRLHTEDGKPSFKDVDAELPEVNELIGSVAPQSQLATILEDYANAIKEYGDYNVALNLTNVNVVQIFPENEQTGNRIMVVDDDSISGGEFEFGKGDKRAPVTEARCVVYSHIPVDFDVDSVVSLTVQPYQPSEDEYPLLMVIGIHPITKVPLPESTEEEHSEKEDEESSEASEGDEEDDDDDKEDKKDDDEEKDEEKDGDDDDDEKEESEPEKKSSSKKPKKAPAKPAKKEAEPAEPASDELDSGIKLEDLK